MSQTIEQRVAAIVSSQLGLKAGDIKASDRLVTDLGADSLDLVEIIMYCEEEFTIEIDDEEIENFGTVSELISVIEKKSGV